MEYLRKLRHKLKKLNPVSFFFNVDDVLESKINVKQHYCGDMHIHIHNPYSTKVGEAISLIDDIAERAAITKMKIIALTPHNSLGNIKKIDERIDYLNDKLSKEIDDYDPVIPIYGTELGFFKHKLVYAFGVNQKNARKVEYLGHTFKTGMSLEQLIKVEERFNRGDRIINGYIIPSGLSDVRMLVVPAHYKSWRGYDEHRIIEYYENGGRISAIEVTNTSSNMFQCDLGRKLRILFGKEGPADIGGSDSHWDKNVGMGYTSFTVPKRKINDSLDIYDCIINHQTTTNYLRVPKLNRFVLARYHYLSPLYWIKFPAFFINHFILK